MTPPIPLRFDAPPPEPPRDDPEVAAAGLPPLVLGDASVRVAQARAYLEAGRDYVRGLHRRGAAGRTVVRLQSLLIDRLLRTAWAEVSGGRPGATLVALGGYGRCELAPHSDVDLLFLYETESGLDAPPEPDLVEAAEAVLYLLWDAGLQVGHAVRTPHGCVAVAEEDHTARTALVDCRRVAGDAGLYGHFEGAILGEIHSRHAEAYIQDKLGEWRDRHDRFADTVFRLEPDVKNGQGGLRDLHTALWVAREAYHVAGLSDLERQGLLPAREVSDLRAARDFLWRVRNAIHYAKGRRHDHLTFDLQEEIAPELGYEAGEALLGVERFMRDYYLAARAVLRISRQLIERCTLERDVAPYAGEGARRVGDGFLVRSGRIAAEDPDVFTRDPLALLRVFDISEAEGLPLLGHTRALIREASAHARPELLHRPEAAATLRGLFERPGTRGDFLETMHQTGVLGALIPEFGRQTGLWQHDLYHTYTVDVHSLFAVRRLMALARSDLDDPRFTPVMQALERPYALYLGTWFHDIGKGLGGRHSELGAAMIQEIARRLRLGAEEAADVEWLVRTHLRMSHVSQRRDLSDVDLIAAFAEEVGSPRRLDMLYLLTFADVGTTGESAWTDWKARLLHELYLKTRAALLAAAEGGVLPDRAAQAREGAADLRPILEARHPPEQVDRFLASVPERYLATVDHAKAPLHLEVLCRLDGRGLTTRRIPHPRAGHTELVVATRDRSGLLADLTGVLAAHGADILGAQIFSLRDGRVLDVFLIQDRRGGTMGDERWQALKRDLEQVPESPGLGARRVAERLRPAVLPPRPVPPVPVQVGVDNDASGEHTVVDVFARDRLGLLHDITRTFHELGIAVWVARIATEAHRATDAFYVTGPAGGKITDPETLERVRRELTERLERGEGARTEAT